MSNILERAKRVTWKEWLVVIITLPISLPVAVVSLMLYFTVESTVLIMRLLFDD